MHSYEVEYWYRWNGDDMDVNYVTVEAEDEETAIKVAKIQAPRGAKYFEIVKYLGISPNRRLANNSNDASAPS